TPVAVGQKALPFFQRARNWIATGPSNFLRTAINILGILTGAYAGQIAAHYAAYRPTELDADRKGACISGDPEGLISALNKLESTHKSSPLVRSINQLLSSHPSTETRIRRLSSIAQTMPAPPPAAPVAEVAPIPVAATGSSPTALITGAALAEQRVSAMDAPAMVNG
ncbi:MAG: M48 family metalloprotease, partial [Rickettsiales bacterium]|nr:M48 family metalloprotease [Rickettsiales bacterium]